MVGGRGAEYYFFFLLLEKSHAKNNTIQKTIIDGDITDDPQKIACDKTLSLQEVISAIEHLKPNESPVHGCYY